jgi:peptidoglycan/LPS O-acetylase OafA/YrhL
MSLTAISITPLAERAAGPAPPAAPPVPVLAAPAVYWQIEAFRGLAALTVMYAHYRWMLPGPPYGLFDFTYTGVDLFFVLSGFVFAPSFFGQRLRLAPFLLRRGFRIYPLYVLAVFVYAALHLLAGHPVDHLGRHLLFLHTWQSREIAFSLNPAFWSLPPEVEFYLALPLLIRFVQGRRAVWVLTGLAWLLHLGLGLASSPADAPVNLPYVLNVHLPGLLVEFLLGVLVWDAVQQQADSRVERPRSLRWLCLGVGGVGWLWLAWWSSRGHGAGAAHGLLPALQVNLSVLAALTYALILRGSIGTPAGGARRSPPWALLLGQLSYGLYLFHNAVPQMLDLLGRPAQGVGGFALCAVLSVLLAWGLHQAIEAPARHFGRSLAQRLTPAPHTHDDDPGSSASTHTGTNIGTSTRTRTRTRTTTRTTTRTRV